MIKTDHEKIAFLADGGYGDWLPIVSLMQEFDRQNPQLKRLYLFVKLKSAEKDSTYGNFPKLKDYYDNVDFIHEEIFIPYEENIFQFIDQWRREKRVDHVVTVMAAYGREYLLLPHATDFNLIKGLVDNHVHKGKDFVLTMKPDHQKRCDRKFAALTKGFSTSVGFHTRLFKGEFHWRGRDNPCMEDDFMMDINYRLIQEITRDQNTVVLLFGNNHRYGRTIRSIVNVRFVDEGNVIYELELAHKCDKFIGAYSGFSIITALRKNGRNFLPLHTYMLPGQPGLIPRADGDYERYHLLGGERIDYLFHFNRPLIFDFMCRCPNTVEDAMKIYGQINQRGFV